MISSAILPSIFELEAKNYPQSSNDSPFPGRNNVITFQCKTNFTRKLFFSPRDYWAFLTESFTEFSSDWEQKSAKFWTRISQSCWGKNWMVWAYFATMEWSCCLSANVYRTMLIDRVSIKLRLDNYGACTVLLLQLLRLMINECFYN